MAPPSPPARAATLFWILLSAAAAWLAFNHEARIRRILQVSAIPPWSVDAAAVDPASSTGYAHGWRHLILPEHNYRSFLWIAQTQQMLAEGRWRVREIGFENAPQGRPLNLPSPYAWGLGAAAAVDHALTGVSRGAAVERAALYADPVSQLLLLALGAGLVAAWFGARQAAVVVLAVAAWFPLAGNFVSGAPDATGCFLGSGVLGLLALGAAAMRGERGTGCMAFAGACGGFGLWLDAPQAVVLPVGLMLGGVALRVWGGGGNVRFTVAGWRMWGVAGAGVALLGYAVEYAPDHLGWRLETNHLGYALAWLGAAELLAWLTTPARAASRRVRVVRGLAGAAVLALPVAWAVGESSLPWQIRPDANRLSVLNTLGADHLLAWLGRDGLSLPVVATLLPVFAVVGLAVLAWRRGARAAVLFFGGPLLVAAAWAAGQPVGWSLVQALALPAAVVLMPPTAGLGWLALAVVVTLPGGLALRQARPAAEVTSLSETELVGLIGRDLGYALTHQSGDRPLTVLAPPELTGALHYYAEIRGLGTLAWENRAGLTAAARIASATSPEEALHLLEQRGVTHVVIPAWDGFLDDYAGLGRAGKTGAEAAQNSFMAAIHRWEQPAWMRPRAYAIPAIAGFEGERVEVFAVGEEQDAPAAMSRLAEYFIETGRLDLAASARQALRKYPAHLGALAATAKVDAARLESATFAETVTRVMPLLEAGADRRGLPWDRRVSLAVVLATARKSVEAQAQLERCVREANEERVRGLSAQALFQLLTLMKRSGLEFTDKDLAALARSLVPPEARGRL